MSARAWAVQAAADIRAEIAELEKLLESIERFGGVAEAPAPRIPKAPGKKQPAPEPARRAAAKAADDAPSAYDPKIRGREHYVEVLRQLGKPKLRADIVGSVPQRSKALNKMAEHGLILEEDGFVRITEAGELYLADAAQED